MRKLACAALSYTCAVIAAHYILPSGALLWGALGFGVLFLLSLLLKALRGCGVRSSASLRRSV